MPEPISTPPRVRHRSKTMTSASRPSALRKPEDPKKVKKDHLKKAPVVERIAGASKDKKVKKGEVKEKKIKVSKKEKKTKKETKKEKEVDKKEKRKKSPERRVKFVPAQAQKIGHIFESPEPTKRREPSPAASAAPSAAPSSAPSSSSGLTSKQKAEQKLLQLTKILHSSAEGESSSCEATDVEEMKDPDASQSEDSSEDESEAEKEKENEKEKEGKDKDESSDEEEEEDDDDDEEEESEDEEGSFEDDTEEGKEEVKAIKDAEDGKKEEKAKKDGKTKDDKVKKEEKEKKGEKEQKDGQPDKDGAANTEHALVPVTQKSSETALALKNSSTDKAAWDAFNRNAKSKMPAALADHYTSSKVELFNMWLEAGRDWQQVQIQVERVQQQKSIASRGWEAVQGKELKKRYNDEAKYTALINARRASGLYYEDEILHEVTVVSRKARRRTFQSVVFTKLFSNNNWRITPGIVLSCNCEF